MATKAKRPVSVWKRPVKVSSKELFKGLSKAAVNVGTGNWGSAAKDAVETASNTFGLSKKKPDEVAWLLVSKALVKACLELINERQEMACDVSVDSEETFR